MATHSSVLAWRIPGQRSLVGCCLWGCTELDMTEAISSSSSIRDNKDEYVSRKYRNKTTIQFSSVTQSCLTLCDPMNRSTPGLPVHHQLPEFTQTHIHRVGDAIQPSNPLSSPSPPALNLSQHQGLFK